MTVFETSAVPHRAATFAKRLRAVLIGISLLGLGIVCALAQAYHSHPGSFAQSSEQKRDAGALIKIVRESTERFKDVRVARTKDTR